MSSVSGSEVSGERAACQSGQRVMVSAKGVTRYVRRRGGTTRSPPKLPLMAEVRSLSFFSPAWSGDTGLSNSFFFSWQIFWRTFTQEWQWSRAGITCDKKKCIRDLFKNPNKSWRLKFLQLKKKKKNPAAKMNLLKLHKTFTEQKETSTWSSETNKVRQAYEKHPDNVKNLFNLLQRILTYTRVNLSIHCLFMNRRELAGTRRLVLG